VSTLVSTSGYDDDAVADIVVAVMTLRKKQRTSKSGSSDYRHCECALL
jgi:hypothetical protein